VEKGNVSAFTPPRAIVLLRLPLPRSLTGYVGRGLFLFLLTMQGLGALEAGFGAHTGASPKPAVCPPGPDLESLGANQAEERRPARGRERDALVLDVPAADVEESARAARTTTGLVRGHRFRRESDWLTAHRDAVI
jgi:hypothetical protein